MLLNSNEMSEAYSQSIDRFLSGLKQPEFFVYNQVWSGGESRVYRATRTIADILSHEIRPNQPVAPAYVLAGRFPDSTAVHAVPVLAPNKLQQTNERGIHYLLEDEVNWLKNKLGFVTLRSDRLECVASCFATTFPDGYGLYSNNVPSPMTNWIGEAKNSSALEGMAASMPEVEICLVTDDSQYWLSFSPDKKAVVVDTEKLIPRQPPRGEWIMLGSQENN